jgi:hypothetical protein
MTRKLTLHIGVPKTGSTALQLFLDANRDVLREEYGLLYPKAAARAGGHHDIAFLLHGTYPEWATRQEKSLESLWSELMSEAEAHDGDIILSSENFYLFPEPTILAQMLRNSEAFEDMAVNVLAYVRPQEELVETWYNQTVKAQGSSATFDECLEEYRELWDFNSELNKWADAFGQESITVRIYRGGTGIGWDIREDFLSHFSLENHSFHFSKKRPNTNLNRDVLEFQRVMNRLPLTSPEKRRFHKQLIELTKRTSNLNIFDSTAFLSDEQKLEVRSWYDESNAKVARTYCDGRQLFDPVKFTGKPFEPYKGLNSEAMASILGWILLQTSER